MIRSITTYTHLFPLRTHFRLSHTANTRHRYTYLIYRQPPNFVIPPLQLAEATRAPFNLQQFVTQGNLTLVGGRFMREGLGTTVTTGPVKDAIKKAEAALADLKLTPSQRAALDKVIVVANKVLGI